MAAGDEIRLHKEFLKAVKNRDFLKQLRLQNEINRLAKETEYHSLAMTVKKADDKTREKILRTSIMIHVLGDIMNGVVIDFNEMVKKLDKTILDTTATKITSGITENAMKLVRMIDGTGDMDFSEAFGDLSDGAEEALTDYVNENCGKVLDYLMKE